MISVQQATVNANEQATLRNNNREITLKAFIECSMNNRLELLIVSGEPIQEELERSLLYVISVYHKVRKSPQVDHFLFVTGRMRKLELRLTEVDEILSTLSAIQPYFEYLGEETHGHLDNLRKLGHNFEYSKDSLLQDLQRIQTAEKRHVLELNKMMTEAQKFERDRSKDATERDYYTTLFDINKHEQSNYKAKEISVFEYCILLSRMEEHVARLRQQSNAA